MGERPPGVAPFTRPPSFRRGGIIFIVRPPHPEIVYGLGHTAPGRVARHEHDTERKTRRQPPYAVILHNDDHNGMDFVIMVLRKVFGYTVEKCVELMLEAHEKGGRWCGFGRSKWPSSRPTRSAPAAPTRSRKRRAHNHSG